MANTQAVRLQMAKLHPRHLSRSFTHLAISMRDDMSCNKGWTFATTDVAFLVRIVLSLASFHLADELRLVATRRHFHTATRRRNRRDHCTCTKEVRTTMKNECQSKTMLLQVPFHAFRMDGGGEHVPRVAGCSFAASLHVSHCMSPYTVRAAAAPIG